MLIIYHWRATGYDPLGRFPNGISMFFDYEPSYFNVVLTLQHLLGYVPDVSDAFPFTAEPPGVTLGPTDRTYQLEEPLQVQSKRMKETTYQAGTVFQQNLGSELLFSPATI